VQKHKLGVEKLHEWKGAPRLHLLVVLWNNILCSELSIENTTSSLYSLFLSPHSIAGLKLIIKHACHTIPFLFVFYVKWNIQLISATENMRNKKEKKNTLYLHIQINQIHFFVENHSFLDFLICIILKSLQNLFSGDVCFYII